jgi:hypothetical protein
VIGYDTADRVLQPRYYHHSANRLLEALTEIRDLGCSFLVAGRKDENGIFREWSQLNLLPQFTDLFKPIPSEAFRKDISSSELRATGQRGSR